MKHRNKRKERTQVLIQATARRRIAEIADNDIEQHRFNKLIEQSVIVEER